MIRRISLRFACLVAGHQWHQDTPWDDDYTCDRCGRQAFQP